jgi:hypothetical protein
MAARRPSVAHETIFPEVLRSMPQRRTLCFRQNIDAKAARGQTTHMHDRLGASRCRKARSSHAEPRASGPAAPLSGTRPPGTAFDQRQREGLSFASSRPSASCQNGQTRGRAFCTRAASPDQPGGPRNCLQSGLLSREVFSSNGPSRIGELCLPEAKGPRCTMWAKNRKGSEDVPTS